MSIGSSDPFPPHEHAWPTLSRWGLSVHQAAVAGILPVPGDTAVESAQAAAVAALRERFGAEYDIVWRFEPNDGRWWGDIATATA
jgi:hypothetical protein